MKLNADCMRNILLAIEDQKAEGKQLVQEVMGLDSFKNSKFTKSYSEQEIVYTLAKLEEADLIDSRHDVFDAGEIVEFYVSSLTFSGHQYLEKIRDEQRWKTVKSIGGKVGDYSLQAIEKIAEGVTSAAISKIFNQL